MEKVSKNSDVSAIDVGIKNKFKWAWLQEKDDNGATLENYICKINKPGLLLCEYCNQTINYGNSGKKDIKGHANSKKHKRQYNIAMTNTTLPSSYTVQGV